ncbi:hypothetical protein BKA63DRAFT_521849 [Paraphoma chrysanthemicola]|nr:hypothetical protein BKA63DRAFT_521849 [Paraphoma chrysanthemicola]
MLKPRLSDLGMAIFQRKQSNILLTFKVLQFVNQLRRRVQPRTADGSTRHCQLGSDALGLRAVKTLSNGRSRRNAKPGHHGRGRVCKRRKNKSSPLGCSPKHGPALNAPDCSDASGEEVQHVLRSVDNHRTAVQVLSTVAGDNGLFLKHHNAPIFEGYSLKQTVQLLVAVTEAISTVADARLRYGTDWLVAQGLDFGLDMDENFVANYEHLLLRLQAELTQALTRKALEELLRGGHDKRQRKLLSWFSEFAEKPRPLSTSFPWTIKPSLAVLWGVCWMFYDRDASEHDGRSDGRVRTDRVLQQLDFPSVQWNTPASSDYVNFGLELIGAHPQHAAQQPSPNNVPAGRNEVLQARNADFWQPDLSPSSDVQFRLPSRQDRGAIGQTRYGQAPPQLPSQNTYYNDGLEQFSITPPSSTFLPQNPGSPLAVYSHLGADNSLNEPWQLPYASSPRPTRHLIPFPQTPSIRVTGTTGSEVAPPHLGFVAFSPTIYHQPQASHLQLNTNFDNAYATYNMSSQISPETSSIQVPQMAIKHERTSSVNSINMPTPTSMSGPRSPMLSPTSGERPHMATSPQTHSRQISEDRSSQDGDEDGSLRKNNSYKRAEEPPRNQDGKMICRHPDCTGQFFDRKCEWSKHMDKHDRPYKCNVKGCEKLQGFTYSGGLLRHEREVHKMHGGTKKSLFCPFHDCKRSSGAGFTRKENLAEHIRRVHRRTSMSADMHGLIIRRETMERSPIAESRHTSESPYTRTLEYRDDDELSALKRKRGSDSGLSDRGTEDLRNEVKRLRQENEEKDSRLRQLEQAVMALQHQTRR